jgi:hypothetical protein
MDKYINFLIMISYTNLHKTINLIVNHLKSIKAASQKLKKMDNGPNYTIYLIVYQVLENIILV